MARRKSKARRTRPVAMSGKMPISMVIQKGERNGIGVLAISSRIYCGCVQTKKDSMTTVRAKYVRLMIQTMPSRDQWEDQRASPNLASKLKAPWESHGRQAHKAV